MAPSATFKSLKQFFIFLILFMKRILWWFFSLETLRSFLLFILNFMMISLDEHAIFSFDLESHVPWLKNIFLHIYMIYVIFYYIYIYILYILQDIYNIFFHIYIYIFFYSFFPWLFSSDHFTSWTPVFMNLSFNFLTYYFPFPSNFFCYTFQKSSFNLIVYWIFKC